MPLDSRFAENEGFTVLILQALLDENNKCETMIHTLNGAGFLP